MKLKLTAFAALTMLLMAGAPVAVAGPLLDYGAVANGTDNPQRPGAVVWMDLLTTDVAVASRFYGDVFGWDVEISEGGEYAYATLDGRPLAAIVAYEDEIGAAEGLWLPSVSVSDVDRALSAVKRHGGAIIEPPEDLPGRGRSMLVEDPTGAVLMLLRASGGDPAPDKQVNAWFWNELWTDDVAEATAFYEGVADYRTVAVKDSAGARYKVMGRDQTPYASVVHSPLPNVEPTWLAYILVDDVDATARKVLKAGGAVLLPPLRDGFNEDIAIVADPTGGVFALQQKKGGQ